MTRQTVYVFRDSELIDTFVHWDAFCDMYLPGYGIYKVDRCVFLVYDLLDENPWMWVNTIEEGAIKYLRRNEFELINPVIRAQCLLLGLDV